MLQDTALMPFLGLFLHPPLSTWPLLWSLLLCARHVSCLAQGQVTLHLMFCELARVDICSVLSCSVQLRVVNVFSPKLRPFSQLAQNRPAVL